MRVRAVLSQQSECSLVGIVEEELIAVGISSSARNASTTAIAASRVAGSMFRGMNISALPIFSGHVSAKIDWSGREDLNLRPPGPELYLRSDI